MCVCVCGVCVVCVCAHERMQRGNVRDTWLLYIGTWELASATKQGCESDLYYCLVPQVTLMQCFLSIFDVKFLSLLQASAVMNLFYNHNHSYAGLNKLHKGLNIEKLCSLISLHLLM